MSGPPPEELEAIWEVTLADQEARRQELRARRPVVVGPASCLLVCLVGLYFDRYVPDSALQTALGILCLLGISLMWVLCLWIWNPYRHWRRVAVALLAFALTFVLARLLPAPWWWLGSAPLWVLHGALVATSAREYPRRSSSRHGGH
jgi:hypothetical protein